MRLPNATGLVAAALLLLAESLTAQCPPIQIEKLTKASPSSSDELGLAVALSGDVLALASKESSAFLSPWVIHLFESGPGGTWVETAATASPGNILAPDIGLDLALDSDTLFVGDPSNQGPNGTFPSGVVHVFERDQGGPGSWGESQALQPSQPSVSFGWNVDLDKDTLVVSANVQTSPSVDGAFVYERTPSGWVETGSILLPDGAYAGGDVAIDGGRIAFSTTTWNQFEGLVFVFERDPSGDWVETARVQEPVPEAFSRFGASLALSGDTLAVGDLCASAQGGKGSAHLFELDAASVWQHTVEVTGSGLGSNGRFGHQVVLDGDAMLVAAQWQAGYPVWFFHRDAGGQDAWGETLRVDSGSPRGIAVEGDRGLVGAAFDDEFGVNAGAGLLFAGLDAPQPETYCTAGTSASGCSAAIGASGTPSASAASGFQLTASQVQGGSNGLFFFGTGGRQGSPWGNGSSYQCVVPPVQRGALLAGAGTPGTCGGSFAYDLTARWAQKPAQNPGPGALVQAQLWYRDAQSTSNQPTSLSDAIEFTTCP